MKWRPKPELAEVVGAWLCRTVEGLRSDAARNVMIQVNKRR